MRQKAAIGTYPVTPAGHKTGTRTGCSTNLRLKLRHLLFCASGTVPQGRSAAAGYVAPGHIRNEKMYWGLFPDKDGRHLEKMLLLLSAHCHYNVYTYG